MSKQNASDVWTPVQESHAILQAAAIIEFAEPVTTIVWNKIADASRLLAKQYSLSSESEIQSIMFELQPGAAPKQAAAADQGIEFFRKVNDQQILEKLTIERNSFRFDTWQYTRWLPFRKFLADCLGRLLPLYMSAVAPVRLSLEYRDLFYAKSEGRADASFLVQSRSDYFDGTALDLSDVWHSNRGWFEQQTDKTRLLVNADIVAVDSQGPMGVRRTVQVRTFESLRLAEGRPETDPVANDAQEALDAFDQMHISLKKRLADILTPEAQAVISLEASNG